MNKIRKKRLVSVLALVSTSFLGVFLILSALNSNLDYFYTPSELMEVEIPQNKRVKLGGMVEKNSVVKNGTNITFNITDYQETISVSFNGVVPDLFKEGSGIVAYGKLINNRLVAENIFAKHDENYMPPSIEISS
ncbi:MAG: cytochrome c maturation protein CcmE [SAR86 cluster bacterium]|uniref:Cytochrome c-type biogenesis protein CcmE n=1 Tax=SAR86 cluster bacterium TaxID=2030880 RepID=A0A937M2E3_9GAMM|nr:cytochrome c maturation protein CcmE [SAR86 cluster bacterium]